MGSNTKEIREMQKQKLEVRLAARKAELVKQGLTTDAQQKKDKVLLHLQGPFIFNKTALNDLHACLHKKMPR